LPTFGRPTMATIKDMEALEAKLLGLLAAPLPAPN
jgi:hypothetical protein